jgi:hypothetical protein
MQRFVSLGSFPCHSLSSASKNLAKQSRFSVVTITMSGCLKLFGVIGLLFGAQVGARKVGRYSGCLEYGTVQDRGLGCLNYGCVAWGAWLFSFCFAL